LKVTASASLLLTARIICLWNWCRQ